jgi:hypothetical protein
LQENRRIQLEQRVNVWQTVLVSDIDGGAVDSILDISYWIQEAKAAHRNDIAPDSYKLILHGTSPDESQNLTDIVIQAAVWQDINLEILRQNGEDNFPFVTTIHEGFSDLIHELVFGRVPVRFDAEYDRETWDSASTIQKYRGNWPKNHREAIAEDAFVEPDGGWEAARREYWIDLDVYDRLAWWNQLVEEL